MYHTVGKKSAIGGWRNEVREKKTRTRRGSNDSSVPWKSGTEEGNVSVRAHAFVNNGNGHIRN